MSAAAGGSTNPVDPAGNGLLHDPDNLDELVKLERMIRRSHGFRIAFATVNHTSLRKRLTQRLQKQLAGLTIIELRLSPACGCRELRHRP